MSQGTVKIRMPGNIKEKTLKDTKVNILGTEYSVSEIPQSRSNGYLSDADGYCDSSIHTIVIDDMSDHEGQPGQKKDLKNYKNKVFRHEIVHAFLEESGIQGECPWNTEEMVDWVALQLPKIVEACKEVGVM